MNNTISTGAQSGQRRRVLVTAAASGIGAEIARAFAETGAEVHICDIDEAALDAFSLANPKIAATHADVTNEADVARVFADMNVDARGLDVLLNNAGTGGPTGLVEDLALAEWRTCISANIDSLFLFARLAAPAMKQAGSGLIINLSSTAGFMGYPMRTPYAASKWAVIGLTKSLAMELGPHGVRVNAICPGAVEGPRMDRVIAAEAEATGESEETIRSGYADACSLKSFVTARDIADMAVFLASPAASKISGQAIAVDGHTEMLSGK